MLGHLGGGASPLENIRTFDPKHPLAALGECHLHRVGQQYPHQQAAVLAVPTEDGERVVVSGVDELLQLRGEFRLVHLQYLLMGLEIQSTTCSQS